MVVRVARRAMQVFVTLFDGNLDEIADGLARSSHVVLADHVHLLTASAATDHPVLLVLIRRIVGVKIV